jgi:hypothetical protein
MKLSVAIFIFFVFSDSYAGGDFREGKITTFSTKNSLTIFTFEQTDKRKVLIKPCEIIKIKLKYGYVPWYSWLPFIESSSGHPSKTDNKKGLQHIKNAYENEKIINFGYMGSGLMPTDETCTFKSRGLLLNNDYIASYHNAV